MEIAIDAPQHRGQSQHQQEQDGIEPEHEGRGNSHLPECDQADEQDFLNADANVFDVGNHPADNPADFCPMKVTHRHLLQMSEDRITQIENNRFAKFQSISLAKMHRHLSKDGRRSERDCTPGDSREIALLNRTINDSGENPGQGWKLNRA